MNRERIYLDHAATTPILPQARSAVLAGLVLWANPSSPHHEGRAARAALETARVRVKVALGWAGEVVFTSGASEALALALGRATVERRALSAVEHDAALRGAPGAQIVAMRGGAVDAAALAATGRAVVAIQHINSETGTVLLAPAGAPEIAAVHGAGGLVLCDAAQLGPGRRLPDGVDMAVISGHKLGAPVGIGALLLRDFGQLRPVGGQEQGYRPGTENLPGALALAEALEAAGAWQTSEPERRGFGERLGHRGLVLAPGEQCSHIFALASPRHDARALLIRLDALGFAVSAGSACSSGSLKPSRVLAGFGIDPDLARRTIRVSLGWSTTLAELDAFAEAWDRVHA